MVPKPPPGLAVAGPLTEEQTIEAARKKIVQEQDAKYRAAVDADFRAIYGTTVESARARRKADDELLKRGIPLAPCVEEPPPPPPMQSLNDPFKQVPPPPPPKIGPKPNQFSIFQFSTEGAEVDMSPSGTEVALNFPEGAEAGMNPSGSGEVVVDCGCSQTGRCVGGNCGQNPAFLLRQKEKYEAAKNGRGLRKMPPGKH